MVKPVSVLSATVRLMPSMATEPFSTIYLISALSNVMATSMELSSFLNERIFPCPSTWPSMMCPPRRSQSLSALSRLTGDRPANREGCSSQSFRRNISVKRILIHPCNGETGAIDRNAVAKLGPFQYSPAGYSQRAAVSGSFDLPDMADFLNNPGKHSYSPFSSSPFSIGDLMQVHHELLLISQVLL